MLCLVVCLLWLFGVVVDDGQGHAQEDDSGFLRRTTMLYSECGLLLCLCFMHRDRGSTDIERWRKTWERIARWG